jgi:Na+/glutamate symporter
MHRIFACKCCWYNFFIIVVVKFIGRNYDSKRLELEFTASDPFIRK